MVDLREPFKKTDIKKLRAGTVVSISGTLFTMRDIVCKYLYDGNSIPFDLHNTFIYHAGPIVKKIHGQWKIISIGPTTSFRQESYLWKLIERFHILGVIGKGEMGKNTTKTCKKNTSCFFNTVGGTAALLASKVKKVKNVYFLKEFGTSEAVWELEVKDFPAIVTIDSIGSNLHDRIRTDSKDKLFQKIQIKKP